MFNIFFDYSKRKDGFMGQENRRYWIIKNTGAKIRITEKQYNKLTSDKLKRQAQATSERAEGIIWQIGTRCVGMITLKKIQN